MIKLYIGCKHIYIDAFYHFHTKSKVTYLIAFVGNMITKKKPQIPTLNNWVSHD